MTITEIADAFGTMHDLSRNAFNSFSLQIPSLAPDLDLRSMDFRKVFNQLGGNLFGNVQEKFDEYASPELKALVESAASSLENAAISKSVELLALSEEKIPYIGFLLSLGTNYALNNFFDAKPQQFGYQRGEWIQLDLGEKVFQRHSDQSIKELVLQDSTFGAGDFFEESTFETKHDFAIGFYVGPTTDVTSHTIFNFSTGEEEVVHYTKIRGLPTSLKQKFDENEELSQIREVRIYQDWNIQNRLGINTDPGCEVIYNDQVFNVVSQRGSSVEIENFKGERLLVAIEDLENHRKPADSSYRYEGASTATFSGFSENFTVCSLEWVWILCDSEDLSIDESANAILGCVRFWVNDKISCVKAWNGEEKLCFKHEVIPVEGEYKDVLRYIEAVAFQQSVSDGRRTKENSLGEKFPLLCFNHSPIFAEESPEGQRGRSFIEKSTEGQQPSSSYVDKSTEGRTVELTGSGQGVFEGRVTAGEIEEAEGGLGGEESSSLPMIAVLGLAVVLVIISNK